MNTKIKKYIIAFVLAFMALPMVAQDYMNIFFKNGDHRKFYMKNITEIVATKVDTEGVEHEDYSYQQITTIYDKYIYKLDDVDSITFTKIDEELAKHNFVTAMPQVFSAIGDCETIADVEKKIDQIKNTEGVVDAWSDGHQLYVSIAEGETIKFHFSHDVESEDSSIENDVAQTRAMISDMANIIKAKDSPLKVLIANQEYRNKNRDWSKLFDPLIVDFKKCGVSVYPLDGPTVDFFYDNSDNPEDPHFFDYDVIFLVTHGGYCHLRQYVNGILSWTEYLHDIVTSDEILVVDKKSDNWWEDNYDSFKEWRDNSIFKDATDEQINFTFIPERRTSKFGSVSWVLYPVLTERFFQDIAVGKFHNPKSILFNTACQSMKGNDGFADHLFSHGLGVYIGYSETDYFGPETGTNLFRKMLLNHSLDKAIDDLPDYQKCETIDNIKNSDLSWKDEMTDRISVWLDGEYNAELVYNPKNENISRLFIFPTVTNEIDQETVLQSFNSSKSIEVSGYATAASYNPDNFSMGFIFWQDEDIASSTTISNDKVTELTNVKVTELTKPLEKGNILFRASLTDFKPDQTYHYRAYTYDGQNYNYGEVFTLYPVLQVAVQKFELGKGEKVSFTITAGSGEYSVESSDKSVAKANVVGNEVYIEAVSEGKEATITVTDTKSGQKATVTVITISYGPPLSIGDAFIADGVTYMVTSIKPLEVQIGNCEKGSGVESAIEWYMRGETGDFTIPSKVKGTDGNIYSVTRLGKYSFGNCSFTSVSIPNSITSIGEMAFLGCSGLTSIKIPESVASIEDYAFYECSGLTSIKIPESVISIGSFAFSKCSSLYSIIIPKNVNSFGYFAFYDCSYLHTVIVLCSPTNIDMGSKQLFKDCNNITEAVFDCSTVTPILCDQTSLKRVTLKGSVTTIGEKAFQGCSSLNTITIPNTVTIIGDNAFRSCRGLTSIVIPNSVTSVGKEAFCGCSGLTSVTISTSVSSIGENTFMNCTSLTSVAIPSSVTELVGGAFANCSGLSSVTIPTSVNSIGVSAFKNCTGLNSVTIPNSVTSIGSYAFMGCSGLTSLTLSKRLTTIGREAFRGCTRLTSVIIPNGVTIVSGGMFSDCTNLVSVYIPSSVSSINWYAFGGCNRLTTVKVNIDNPLYIEKTVFSNSANATLYVPKGCVDIYSQKSGWSDFKTIKEMN